MSAVWPLAHVIWADPPGRRSIVAVLPNQLPRPSAVVSAAHTLAGGCAISTTRSMRSGNAMTASKEVATDRLPHYSNRSIASTYEVVAARSPAVRLTTLVAGWPASQTVIRRSASSAFPGPGPAVRQQQMGILHGEPAGLAARVVSLAGDLSGPAGRLPLDRPARRAGRRHRHGLGRGRSPHAVVVPPVP